MRTGFRAKPSRTGRTCTCHSNTLIPRRPALPWWNDTHTHRDTYVRSNVTRDPSFKLRLQVPAEWMDDTGKVAPLLGLS